MYKLARVSVCKCIIHCVYITRITLYHIGAVYGKCAVHIGNKNRERKVVSYNNIIQRRFCLFEYLRFFHLPGSLSGLPSRPFFPIHSCCSSFRMRYFDVCISVTQETRSRALLCCSGNIAARRRHLSSIGRHLFAQIIAHIDYNTQTHIHNIILYTANKLRCSKTLVYTHGRTCIDIISFFPRLYTYIIRPKTRETVAKNIYTCVCVSSNQTFALESRGISSYTTADIRRRGNIYCSSVVFDRRLAATRFRIGVLHLLSYKI